MKASARHVPALAVSLLLHLGLLVPLLGGAQVKAPSPPLLPNSVAMEGTSIEVDAPTPELASAPGQAAREVEVEPEAAPTASETEKAEVEKAKPEKAEPEKAEPEKAEPEKTKPKPQPRPAPPPPRATAPVPAASHAAASAAGGSEAPAGAPAPGAFGAERLAPGVRRVGYAFSRNIPPATKGDEAWRELPAGVVGTVRVVISVGDDHRLGEFEVLPPRRGEPPTPAPLKRLVDRTMLLMRTGQLALSGSNDPGKELLIIEVRLSDEAPEEDAKGVVTSFSFSGATPGNPGRASFRYDSGRRFEAIVTVMPAPN